MDVRNCRKCGKIFNYVAGAVICPACRECQETEFQRVKEYIRENKQVTIPMIARECEVGAHQIRQWIRQERLVFSDDSVIGINCESCGKTIKTGRFCEICKAEIARGLNANFSKEEVSEVMKPTGSRSARMRFLE